MDFIGISIDRLLILLQVLYVIWFRIAYGSARSPCFSERRLWTPGTFVITNAARRLPNGRFPSGVIPPRSAILSDLITYRQAWDLGELPRYDEVTELHRRKRLRI